MQGKNNGERKNRVKKTEDSSCSLLSHFWSTSWSPFSTCYIPFQSSGSQESKSSNRVRFGAEMRKIWPWKTTALSWGTISHLAKLELQHAKFKVDGSYAVTENPTCKSDFATCELGAQHAKMDSKFRNQLARFSQVTMQCAKSTCELGYLCTDSFGSFLQIFLYKFPFFSL